MMREGGLVDTISTTDAIVWIKLDTSSAALISERLYDVAFQHWLQRGSALRQAGGSRWDLRAPGSDLDLGSASEAPSHSAPL